MSRNYDFRATRSCGMFVSFMPLTDAAVPAWRELASVTDGTGKVLATDSARVIAALRKAGYSVTTRRQKIASEELDLLYRELDSIA
jgi:hypothetical protein